MNKRIISQIFMILTVLLLSMVSSAALTEGISPEILLTGAIDSPIEVTLASPSFKLISQFGEERTNAFNRLLSHLSLSVSYDGNLSRAMIKIDQDPVFSFIDSGKENAEETSYPFKLDQLYDNRNGDGSEENSAFLLFLEEQFFTLNRLLDDLYPVFEKAADAFIEFGKPSAASLNFSGYGKGVRKLTIPLTDSFVKESFQQIAAGLADSEECRQFISRLVFSGPQKIILLYDQNDNLLRINYDGNAGLTEDSMRRVSIVWRCVRTENLKKDHLTMKTPALKGYDKYNITFIREKDTADDSHQPVSWDLQLDLRADQIKKKIAYSADLLLSDNDLTGKVVFSEKADGSETKTTIIPSIRKEKHEEYTGTIEITKNSGKIVFSDMEAAISINPGTALSSADLQTMPDDNSVKEPEYCVRDQMITTLIRRIFMLPSEDLEFVNRDIPDDIWDSIVKSLL